MESRNKAENKLRQKSKEGMTMEIERFENGVLFKKELGKAQQREERNESEKNEDRPNCNNHWKECLFNRLCLLSVDHLQCSLIKCEVVDQK